MMQPAWFADSEEDEKEKSCEPSGVFFDVAAMKANIRRNMMKEPYDVAKYYHEEGLWRTIATSNIFGKATLAVIGVNAVWIGVDTDHNAAEVLLNAHPLFQIVEHFFCVYFSFEWLARFMSFRLKRYCFRDGWFMFDSLLVFFMVMETWVFTTVVLVTGGSGQGGLGNASVLRMARLARLSRMARMARLLKAMPELMILIKGIATATRSVFFTLCLLLVLLYIFGIAFTQLLAGTRLGETLFKTVGASMYTLMCSGTLMDNVGLVLELLMKESFYLGLLFLLFVLLATITVLNMLIGVLCEVVSTVAAVEKEAMLVNFVKQKLMKVLEELDEDGNGTISKEEFMKVLDSREACEALDECGVDVEGLYEYADFIFADDDDENDEVELGFTEFMEIMLKFRGTNAATVKDIADLTKYVKTAVQQNREEVQKLGEIILSSYDTYLLAGFSDFATKSDQSFDGPPDMHKDAPCSQDLPDNMLEAHDEHVPKKRPADSAAAEQNAGEEQPDMPALRNLAAALSKQPSSILASAGPTSSTGRFEGEDDVGDGDGDSDGDGDDDDHERADRGALKEALSAMGLPEPLDKRLSFGWGLPLPSEATPPLTMLRAPPAPYALPLPTALLHRAVVDCVPKPRLAIQPPPRLPPIPIDGRAPAALPADVGARLEWLVIRDIAREEIRQLLPGAQ